MPVQLTGLVKIQCNCNSNMLVVLQAETEMVLQVETESILQEAPLTRPGDKPNEKLFFLSHQFARATYFTACYARKGLNKCISCRTEIMYKNRLPLK